MKSLFHAFIRLSFGFVLLLTVATANAQTIAAEVKYIPVTGNQGLFNVVYSNTNGSRFSIEILDGDGNQLYWHIFTDKKFNRNFQLADPDSYSKLVFVIHNLGDKSFQRFEVEANIRLVEVVNVKEVVDRH